MTPQQYAQVFQEQGGVCAICKQPETACDPTGVVQPLSVDHDHKTGKVRKLLCNRCNYVVGVLENMPDIQPGYVEAIFTYLIEHRAIES